MKDYLLKKEEGLIEYIKSFKKVAIAFSGGVDSTYLLYISKEALGENITSVIVKTDYMFIEEIEDASSFAKENNIENIVLNLPIPEEIINNPENRCYLCKTRVFESIINLCIDKEIFSVFDGTNIDDTKTYRPGLKALKELGVISPLMVNGFTKEEIRELSLYHKLDSFDKPSNPCILTRIAHGERISEEGLRRIEKGEYFIKSLGFREVRIRSIKDTAKIEIPADKLGDIFKDNKNIQISDKLKELGFKSVTIDLDGYKMGSMSGVKDE